MARTNIRAILADPVKRRELSIRFIMSAQHMEGIETTREQAEDAYDRVQIERRRPRGKAATASKSEPKGRSRK